MVDRPLVLGLLCARDGCAGLILGIGFFNS
jgi:hypothetical protein